MTSLSGFAFKDRAAFYTNGNYPGALKAYSAASKSVLSELKRRTSWPKRSEARRVKEGEARKRLKKVLKKREANEGRNK